MVGVVWIVVMGMVFLYFCGKVCDVWSDELFELGLFLCLVEIDYDLWYDCYFGVFLFVFGIVVFVVFFVVDLFGWNVLFFVDVGNCCLIVVFGVVVFFDR